MSSLLGKLKAVRNLEYNSYYDIECIIHWEMQYVIVIYLVIRLVTFEVVHSNSSTCMGNASNFS